MILCDTSVLVAATVEEHQHHLPSNRFVDRIRNKKTKGLITGHTLAEYYATMTATPFPKQVAAGEVLEVIEKQFIPLFDMVDLNAADYRAAVRRVAARNLRSGVIFDALVFQAALKAKVKTLATWNLRHFTRLGDELQIVTPEALVGAD